MEQVEQGLPSAVHAEITIIGACLLDETAINDALELLVAEDMSLDSHQRIFRCICDLSESGNAVDYITVMDELQRRKELDTIGGPAYLAYLSEGIPRKPKILDYCKIVKDKSVLRSIAALADVMLARASDNSEVSKDILEEAEERILELAQQQSTQGFTTILDAIEDAGSVDAYMEVMCDPKEMTGLPTGFIDLDKILGGLQKKSLILIAARPSMGKALRCDEPILTIYGWKRNDELKLGDRLASIDGGESFVTGVFPQGVRKMFSVAFSDGRTIEADEEHLWSVSYRAWVSPRVLTTSKLREMLTRKRYQNRLWIDTFDGNFGSEAPLPLHPYAMGALIGNGDLTSSTPKFSTRDQETRIRLIETLPHGMTMRRINKYDWSIADPTTAGNRVNTVMSAVFLRGLCSHEKFIPQEFLRAGRAQRVELLRGLMDTDGNVEKTGSLVYSTSSLRLAENVQYLARSLGGQSTISRRDEPVFTYKGERKIGLPAYRVYISHEDASEFVHLKRKKERVAARKRSCRLTVTSITESNPHPCQCIAVSHPSKLYIASHGFIVTHNTASAINIAVNVVTEDPEKVVAVFSLESSKESLHKRMLAGIAEVSSKRAQEGFISHDEKVKLKSALLWLADKHIEIDDTSGLSVMQMRSKCRRLKQKWGRLDLIVIDYVQLVRATGKNGNREQEVSSVSRGSKALAKGLDVPVLALAQLSRKNEERGDKRPMLSDLRESGSLEMDADVVAFIHRPEYYASEDDPNVERGIAEIIIAKNREGSVGTRKLAYRADITKFSNLHIERGAAHAY